ncbi:hypothetical protein EVAR_20821_1 [Eumeta japonica]|uniref:Uncharacterized protein n=1 Tax=Eumeta variegata TaxID=151549 RepID=A0A4C1UEF9_EUMVA|nr:hypothetical protein EVAR_20821_1 [Eumeta japonica]
MGLYRDALNKSCRAQDTGTPLLYSNVTDAFVDGVHECSRIHCGNGTSTCARHTPFKSELVSILHRRRSFIKVDSSYVVCVCHNARYTRAPIGARGPRPASARGCVRESPLIHKATRLTS